MNNDKSKLMLPTKCNLITKEEMTYISGGIVWANNNYYQTCKEAYAELISSGDAATALALGGGVGGVVGAMAGMAITILGTVAAPVFYQWAGAYYAAADELYLWRNAWMKHVSWTERLSGIGFYISCTINEIS